MKTIGISGEEYSLYLRAHQNLVCQRFMECFETGDEIRTEQELLQMMQERLRVELPMEDSCKDVLKEILTVLLDRCEIQGILMMVTQGKEHGYLLAGNAGNAAKP